MASDVTGRASRAPRRADLAVLLCLGLAPVGAAAQEFLQFDLSPSDSSLSASATRGPLGASLSYSRFSGGDEVTFAVSHALSLDLFGAGATFRVGPSVQKPEDGDLELGAKLAAEQYRPTDWGGVFLLGEVNSVNGGYFAMAQPGFSNGVAVEVTAAGNDGGYSERALAVSKRIGESPWRLRAGYRFRAEEVFIGVSLNTY